MKTDRIGFLGAGNMGAALIRGLLAAGKVSHDQVRASDVRYERLQDIERECKVGITSDNRELVGWSSLVVLAVKPQVVAPVLEQVAQSWGPDKLLVSIAAGISLADLAGQMPAGARIMRVMPNTPALVRAGITAIARGSHATEQDLARTVDLFEAVGRTAVVEEGLMNAVTGLSGSGPAFVMVIMEALADGGVKMGLPRDIALLLAAQTLLGAAKLQLDTAEHPARLKDLVASPGGTTIAGLHALERGRLRATLIDAVEAATRRSAELGKS